MPTDKPGWADWITNRISTGTLLLLPHTMQGGRPLTWPEHCWHSQMQPSSSGFIRASSAFTLEATAAPVPLPMPEI